MNCIIYAAHCTLPYPKNQLQQQQLQQQQQLLLCQLQLLPQSLGNKGDNFVRVPDNETADILPYDVTT